MLKTHPAFKSLAVLACFLLPFALKAQPTLKPNWQNLDLKTDSVFGMSTEKAYDQLLKDKKHVPVLVAVIDGGVDTAHEDLKAIIWNHPGEKPGNNVDDDKNGYADDTHGWNFIGGAKGDVHYDNMELVRQIRMDKTKFDKLDTTKLSGADQQEFERYTKMRNDLAKQLKEANRMVALIGRVRDALDAMIKQMGKTAPTVEDFKLYTASSNTEEMVKNIMVKYLGESPDFATFRKEQIDEPFKHYDIQLKYRLNIDFDPRGIVGDNYTDSSEHFYGNSDVMGPDADHGSHVSGIIGAVRDNNIGVKGVANDVMIISVRTVPDGDERDKDVANAIRYAAANGAKVINMSFGKPYSFDKKAVDEAVKFAMSKDVLIVHAAGNDNKDLDVETNFPNRTYADGSGQPEAWIEVGASGSKDDETLKASFSNYGQKGVDVFAPGVKIYSTTPGSTYAEHDGTSMAAPMVAGLAALIRSYYPKLTAVQVKDIILRSVVKVDHKVSVKDNEGSGQHRMKFATLCISGGIVNAYNALQLAATY